MSRLELHPRPDNSMFWKYEFLVIFTEEAILYILQTYLPIDPHVYSHH